jgi:hypothetical protein
MYGKVGFDKAKVKFLPNDLQKMTDRVVAITGANAGMWYVVCVTAESFHINWALLMCEST